MPSRLKEVRFVTPGLSEGDWTQVPTNGASAAPTGLGSRVITAVYTTHTRVSNTNNVIKLNERQDRVMLILEQPKRKYQTVV